MRLDDFLERLERRDEAVAELVRERLGEDDEGHNERNCGLADEGEEEEQSDRIIGVC